MNDCNPDRDTATELLLELAGALHAVAVPSKRD